MPEVCQCLHPQRQMQPVTPPPATTLWISNSGCQADPSLSSPMGAMPCLHLCEVSKEPCRQASPCSCAPVLLRANSQPMLLLETTLPSSTPPHLTPTEAWGKASIRLCSRSACVCVCLSVCLCVTPTLIARPYSSYSMFPNCAGLNPSPPAPPQLHICSLSLSVSEPCFCRL